MFNWFKGLLHFELKRDRLTGVSQGFGFVLYSSPQVAKQAIERLHQMEYPPKSGYLLKVFYAQAPEDRHNPPKSEAAPQQDFVSPFGQSKVQAQLPSVDSDQSLKVLEMWKEQQRPGPGGSQQVTQPSNKSQLLSSLGPNSSVNTESLRPELPRQGEGQRAFTVREPIQLQDSDLFRRLSEFNQGPHHFYSQQHMQHRGGENITNNSFDVHNDLL